MISYVLNSLSKQLIKFIFSLSLIVLSFVSFGQESIKIMLITSERKVPDQAFFKVFERMPDVKYTEVIQPKANEWI